MRGRNWVAVDGDAWSASSLSSSSSSSTSSLSPSTLELAARRGSASSSSDDGAERSAAAARSTAALIGAPGRGKERSFGPEVDERIEGTAEEEEHLPRLPLLIITFVMFTNALGITIIFPFLPFMVRDFGVPMEKVGYYAGLVASSMFAGRILSSFAIGRVGDEYGRKPVLVVGQLVIIVTNVGLGLATSLTAAIVWRFLSGALNGIIGTGKAMLNELCSGPKSKAKGMTVIGGTWGVGLIAGSALGGVLAQPADKWPSVFGGTLFETHPYLLPLLVSCVVPVITLPLTVCFLPETTGKRARAGPAARTVPIGEAVDDAKAGKEEERVTLRMLVAQRAVRGGLVAYGLASLAEIMFQELFALWATLHIELGGLGFSSTDLGLALTASGTACFVVQVFFFPRIQARLGGPLRTFRLALYFAASMTALFPLLGLVRHAVALLWTLLLLLISLRISGVLAGFTSSMLILNNSTDKGTGAVQGLATTVAAFFRVIGPLLVGPLFAVGVEKHLPFPLDYHAVFLLTAAVAAAAAASARMCRT